MPNWPHLQRLSERLLSLSTELADDGIRSALADLARFARAGRVYVFLLTEDGQTLDRAHEWCDEGVAGHDFSGFRGVPVTAFPWSMAQFRDGHTIFVPDAAALPAEAEAERAACSALEIGAYVNLPLSLGNRLVGWLGFDTDAPNPPWSDRDFEMMRTAGRMLAFTIDRVRREEAFRAEQALSRRFAALGAFAAGLGHEVNNPLAYVSLNLELLERRLESGGDTKALGYVRDSLGGVRQIAQTVETLRAFSRPKSIIRVPIHVGQSLDATLKLVGPQLALRAILSQEGDTDGWVEAAPSELGQVFANLLQNAIDALPEGRADEHRVSIRAEQLEQSMVLEFRDSGPGFSAADLPHVFEPFFTTRDGGGGSGIGLAVCYSIVHGLGGTIEADNIPGGGALIRVTLPIADAPLRPRSVGGHAGASARRRILVIDDLEPLRRAIAAALETHEVVEAGDGRTAIALLERDQDWDVLICDLRMPNGTGRDVFEFVADRFPELRERIVFTSGGGDDRDEMAFPAELPNRVLLKPLGPQALHEAVNAVPPRRSR